MRQDSAATIRIFASDQARANSTDVPNRMSPSNTQPQQIKGAMRDQKKVKPGVQSPAAHQCRKRRIKQ